MTNRKRNILLLNPPGENIYLRDYYCSHSSKAHYYWGPYDLIVLSGILSQKHNVQVIDAIADKLTPDQTMRKTLESGCDTIVFLTGAVSWDEDFALLEKIDAASSHKIHFIGNGDILFAKDTEYLTHSSFLDAVILDFTSDDILTYLEGCSTPLTSLSYKTDGGDIVVGTRDFGKEEFSLPLPRYALFPYKKYRIPHGIRRPYAGMLTDYGCPYHCEYCIGGELGFKLRNIDNVIDEMKYLKSLGIKELWIKDLTFGAHKQRTIELLERMIRDQLGFTWVCLSRANVLNQEMLDLMKRAGCHTIQLGVETASQELLDGYTKGLTKEQIVHAVALCRKTGIRILAHYMLGLPGDTEENIQETINFAVELDTEFASFNVVMPRMGTKFRQMAIEEGLITDEINILDNSISFPVYETSDLSKEKLWELRNLAIRKFHLRPHFLFKRLFGVRSRYELSTLFREGLSLLLTTVKKEKPPEA